MFVGYKIEFGSEHQSRRLIHLLSLLPHEIGLLGVRKKYAESIINSIEQNGYHILNDHWAHKLNLNFDERIFKFTEIHEESFHEQLLKERDKKNELAKAFLEGDLKAAAEGNAELAIKLCKLAFENQGYFPNFEPIINAWAA